MTVVLIIFALALGLALGYLVGIRRLGHTQAAIRDEVRALSAQAAADTAADVYALTDARLDSSEQVIAPVRESLQSLTSQLSTLERDSASWRAELRQQVDSVRISGTELRHQTQALADALGKPHVRGNWGELHLRRSLELAGLADRCDFDSQVHVETPDGVQRPDVVVHLAGNRTIVLDSKVPLDAFLAAHRADNDDERASQLRRHAAQVRSHVNALAAKAYWQQFATAPEFVVLFIPGEAMFAQAAETDPTLLDDAARKNVMLATPATLIAMLKTVAYAWRQESVAANAVDVQRLGRELHDRLGTLGGHLDKMGRALSTAVTSYNSTVGSLETRVLVSARRMRDLDVVDHDVGTPRSLTVTPQPLTAPELLEPGLLEPTGESPVVGPPGREQFRRRAANE